jgi:integrase
MVFMRKMSSNKIGFTAPKIVALRCEQGKSQSIYWDSRTPNLGVRITPAGTKSFIFETWFNGKSLRITIGDVNTWAIDTAQAEARRLKVLTDKGTDPREEKADIKAKTIARQMKGVEALVVWNEYIKDRKPQWGARHLFDHNDMVRIGGGKVTRGLKHGQSKTKQAGMLLELLSMPLNQINRDNVLAWLKKESAKRPTRTRLALSLLKAFMTWASDQPKYRSLVDAHACDRLARELPSKQAKDDCLQREQLTLWFDGARKINNPVISYYLQILLLTGARRNELASLKWADVDTQWHTALIRDKVEGNRKIPLTPYVELLLNNLKRTSKYVFHSPTAKSGYLTEPRIAHKQAVDEAGLPNLTIQGLRRSFGTMAEWTECPAGISAQIMGHKPTAIAEKHYRKRSIDLLRQWHIKIEKFMLDEAGILQPKVGAKRLRIVA